MTVARLNEFNAAEGRGDDVYQAMRKAADSIRAAQGCLAVSVLRSEVDPRKTVVFELWESVNAHQGAAAIIPRDAVAEIIAMLATPPVGEYFQVDDADA